ncbi:hypothetical protein FRB99_002731 [Tulasnella sp. 403]|nr:hypothetical protein FRB99_002731 [Tulasnella sp. 403]
MKVQPSLEPPEDVYCYQHIGKILRPLESYHSVAKKTITFSDWIPDYLPESTKGALRSEMVRPLSESEADGQMYCIKLRDAKQPPDVIQLKVGRTTNVNRRTDQWAKSCGSKTHILLGFYPEGNGDNVGMLPGRITTDRKVKNTHKLERLILLELADLATYQPYLSEDFICNSDDEGKTVKNEGSEMPLKSKTPQTRRSKTQQPAQAPCDDCGAVHREVFTFVRPQDVPLKGQEWEKIVRPVIKRWAKFVETYT